MMKAYMFSFIDIFWCSMAYAKEEWHQLIIKVYSGVIENSSIRLNCLHSL